MAKSRNHEKVNRRSKLQPGRPDREGQLARYFDRVVEREIPPRRHLERRDSQGRRISLPKLAFLENKTEQS